MSRMMQNLPPSFVQGVEPGELLLKPGAWPDSAAVGPSSLQMPAGGHLTAPASRHTDSSSSLRRQR